MLAADAIFEALLANDFSAKQLRRYERLVNESWMMKELRNACPTAKIIAISGSSGRLAAAQTFSQCTFEKPLNMEEFLDAVQVFASAPGSSVYMLQSCSLAAVHSVHGDA